MNRSITHRCALKHDIKGRVNGLATLVSVTDRDGGTNHYAQSYDVHEDGVMVCMDNILICGTLPQAIEWFLEWTRDDDIDPAEYRGADYGDDEPFEVTEDMVKMGYTEEGRS